MRLARLLEMALPAVLAGCAGGSNIIDNSPREVALQRVEQVSFAGSRGYFAYTGEQLQWTTASRRRVQQDIQFTESTLGALQVGARRANLYELQPSASLMQVNYPQKRYQRCDLLGCFEYSPRSEKVPPQSPVLDTTGCRVSVLESRVSLEPASQTRDIAGHVARLHQFVWQLQLQDEQRRAGLSRLQGQLWLSQAGAEQPLLTQEQLFLEAYLQQLGRHWGGLSSLLPLTPLAVIERDLLMQLGAPQRATAVAGLALPAPARQGPTLSLAGDLDWIMLGDICGRGDRSTEPARRQSGNTGDQSRTSTQPGADGISSFGDFVTAIVTELKGPDAATQPVDPRQLQDPGTLAASVEPVFTYRWETSLIRPAELSENQMRAPAGFENRPRF